MPKLTLLSRISDGLPLAASMEDEKDHRELDGYKAQAKKLLKTMSNGAPARVSVESGGSVFQCARASDTPHPSPTARPPLPLTPPLCRVSQLHQPGGGLLYVSDGEVVPQAVRASGSCTTALAHPPRRLCPSPETFGREPPVTGSAPVADLHPSLHP